MTGPHWVHLVPAERELLAECHRYRKYLAVCGALLPTAELESSECEAGCERDVAYCLGCLRAANGRNFDAGLDVDCPPGAIERRIR